MTLMHDILFSYKIASLPKLPHFVIEENKPFLKSPECKRGAIGDEDLQLHKVHESPLRR